MSTTTTTPATGRRSRPSDDDAMARFQLCVHEAGHAVIAALRGAKIVECWATAEDGRVKFTVDRQHHADIAWAGPFAELMHTHGDCPPEDAIRAAFAEASPEDRTLMRGRMPRHIEPDVRFAMPAIRRLATWLYKYGKATPADIERALGVRSGVDIGTVRWAYRQRIDPRTVRTPEGGAA
ncbi:hypothetical protein CRM89_23750 [Nocardia sp. FDAARGOS_372]|uniref:hypothetical protein n=1 Tax=Nocardia sp. FDAARGOS_372 TaxID=2018066 RepID=UPI000BEFC91D|nr:hypothetical protein [Nocardia sp. FDAARGOS_372]PEH78614.1 hypothetical protein CRM89_23750 [Nocardia sp. FDAARGOS_372]